MLSALHPDRGPRVSRQHGRTRVAIVEIAQRKSAENWGCQGEKSTHIWDIIFALSGRRKPGNHCVDWLLPGREDRIENSVYA